MGQGQPRRAEVAAFSDPFAGEPLRGGANSPEVFSDPFAGEPLRMGTKGANLPEMRPVASHEQAQPTWADRAGMNEPTSSVPGGFLRGAATGALDLLQGAAANVTGQLNSKLDAENAIRREAGLPETATAPRVQQPEGFSGSVGAALPVAAEMAVGGAPVARGAINAIPRAERAGRNFEKVMGAAKDITVDVGPAGDHALRVYDLAQKGAYLPKPVANFLQWVTSPKKAPLTYKDSRDFASAMSRLSAAERSSMTPIVKREVAQMAADLNLANANAAKAAGMGAEYKSAMREYANAMRIRDAVDATLKHSKKAALGAAGLGGAYYLFKD